MGPGSRGADEHERQLTWGGGQLGDVLAESKKLADKPLAVAAPWLRKIEARHEIETALANLDQSLKNALAGSADLQKPAEKGAN